MKKKMNNHLDVKHNNIDKSAENKENTNYPDVTNEAESGDAGLGTSTEYVSDRSDSETEASDKVVSEVKLAVEKLAEMQDRYIRLSAEFDNYRKRTLREKMESSRYAGENLLMAIIPLMDDFERALKHMDTSADCTALREGINIIYGKFGDFLKQNGIREIESINTDFNVDLHDAVAKIPVEDADKKGKVVDVLLKGYYLQDKVLRHAKVVVGD